MFVWFWLVTCGFNVFIGVKNGVGITVKFNVRFNGEIVIFNTVKFNSVNIRTVIFNIALAVRCREQRCRLHAILGDGLAGHAGLLFDLGVCGVRVLGEIGKNLLLVHLTFSLAVFASAFPCLTGAVFLTHRVDCRCVLVVFPVCNGIDAVLKGDKAEVDERLHGLTEGHG